MELLGMTLGNYRLDRLLGTGHLGAVYLAHDLSMDCDVVVKLLQPQVSQQPGFRDRFPREVSSVILLDHPGLIKVMDFGQYKDQLYVVSEYIPGDNLRQLLDKLILKRQWGSLNDAVCLVEQLCETRECAHKHGQ